MKRILTISLAVLAFAMQPLSAQSDADYNYRKAIEILEDDGNPDEVRKLLNQNINDNPKHIDSYLLLAMMDRIDSEYSSALHIVNMAMKNNHKNSGISDGKLLWWKASVYADLQQYQTAAAYMKEALRKVQKQDYDVMPQMQDFMAHLYYWMDDYDASDAVYRDMMKADDSSLRPRIGFARNMIAREKFDEALEMLNECARYDRNYPETYRCRMHAYEGKKEYRHMIDAMIALYEKTDDIDDISMSRLIKDRKYSLAVIKGKAASDSDNPYWEVLLASLYQELHMYVDAVLILDHLIDNYGYVEDILNDRAECYESLGMSDLALADVEKLLEICNSRDKGYYYGLRGEICRLAGRYEEAVRDFTVYIDRYPTAAFGYYARGWSKELSGDLEAALKDYNEGIDIDDSYPYIYLMRGSLFLKKGEKEKAMSDFETVVAKDTALSESSCCQYALNFLGRVSEAEEWMQKIIEEYPDDPGNWYDKSCLYARMGRLDEAVEALKVAFEKGFRSFAHIDHDDDMDPVRDREDFADLMEQYRQVHEEEIKRLGKSETADKENIVSEVDMKKTSGGTYEVACAVNGLPLKMIFDTGAADVTISSVEASFMLKNGYLSDGDVKGKRNYVTASGDIHEGTVLRLREIRLGDAVLKNIEASVVHSQKAPLLLGQSVLEKFGTITIDNVNSKLLIKQ